MKINDPWSGLPRFKLGPSYKEKRSDYLFEGHQHAGYELYFVDRGTVCALVDGQGMTGRAGDFLLFFPGQHHTLWADEATAPSVLNLWFTLPGGPKAYPGLATARNTVLRADREVRDLLSAMQAAWEADTPRGKALARLRLAELLLMLPGRTAPKKAAGSRTADNARIQLAARTERYVLDHLAEAPEIPRIAAALGVGESTLRHAFKRITGRSLGQRIADLRASRARELLRGSGLTVTEIADRIGFATVHAFCRAFKKLTGMTPLEYSRSVR